MDELLKRYKSVIDKIGAPALLELPEDVKAVLKNTTDLETKVFVLEQIAKNI